MVGEISIRGGCWGKCFCFVWALLGYCCGFVLLEWLVKNSANARGESLTLMKMLFSVKSLDGMRLIYSVIRKVRYKLNLSKTHVIPQPTLNKRFTNVRRIMLAHLRPLFNVI